MLDKVYWKTVIDNLINPKKANWAAHVIASNIEILNELLLVMGREEIITNCLLCYSVDFAAQSYLDSILSNFSIKELVNTYKKLKQRSLQTAGALMWLLEDIDPEFQLGIVFTLKRKEIRCSFET